MSTLVRFNVLYEGGTSTAGVLWEGDLPKEGQIITVPVDNVPREVQILKVWPAMVEADRIIVTADCRVTTEKP